MGLFHPSGGAGDCNEPSSRQVDAASRVAQTSAHASDAPALRLQLTEIRRHIWNDTTGVPHGSIRVDCSELADFHHDVGVGGGRQQQQQPPPPQKDHDGTFPTDIETIPLPPLTLDECARLRKCIRKALHHTSRVLPDDSEDTLHVHMSAGQTYHLDTNTFVDFLLGVLDSHHARFKLLLPYDQGLARLLLPLHSDNDQSLCYDSASVLGNRIVLVVDMAHAFLTYDNGRGAHNLDQLLAAMNASKPLTA